MKNKKLISLILVCAMMLVSTFTAYAEPTERQSVSEPSQIVTENGVVEESGEFYEEIEAEEETFGTASSGAAMRSSSYEFFGQSTVPDGIYALQNLGNGSRWMDVQYDSTDPGYHMQQFAYGSTPADTQSAAALYKVTQVGNTGRYVIRLMLNTNLTFRYDSTSGYILTKTIPANDADVDIYDTFYISRNGGGYTIRSYGRSNYISSPNSMASGMNEAPACYLLERSLSSAGNQARWIFEGQTTYIDDGVYALENVANTNRWMDTEQDNSSPGYHIQQYDYGDIPTVNFNRGALFKFAQVGSTGQYVIRSMLNNRMSFGFSNGEIITKNIPTNDNSVSSSDRFIIQFWNGGYILRPYGQNYIVASDHSTASGVSGAPDSYLVPRTRSSAGNMGRWELYKYTGGHNTNVLFVRDRSFVAGETVMVEMRVRTTRINTNDIYGYMEDIYVSSGWNSTTKKLSVFCHYDGDITIYADVKNAAGSVVTTISIDYSIVLPFEEGEYFIQNKELGNYVQIDDNANYSTDGAKLEVHDLDGGDYQRWDVIHLSDEYYKILSLESNLAISVRSGMEDESEEYLIQEEYTASRRQQWRFVKYTDGSYEIKPLSEVDYSTDWCMAAGDGLFSNGRNVEQKEYTNNSDYKDRWILTRIMPISGYEIEYAPDLWDENSNCYSYALNNRFEMMNPGRSAGISYNQLDTSASLIKRLVKADSEVLGFLFEPIGKYEQCSNGAYKVALVIAPHFDYHWYRQNPDGLWSHKRGSTAVTNIDADDELIIDPETANRLYGNPDYPEFVGFFEVTPLQTSYSLRESVEDNSSIKVSPQKRNLPSLYDVTKIHEGMAFNEVTEAIGLPQRLRYSGVMVVEYDLSNGQVLIVHYSINKEKVYIVSKTEIGERNN